MQNNEPKKNTARLWKEKGYYMILSFCILAIGVGGYFFVTGALDEEAAVQETLSIPTQIEESTEQETPAKPEDSRQETPTQTAPEQTQPLSVLPVSGEVLQDYAMDHLTYHETTGDWRAHNGVDLSAQLGQEVKAARAGTVSAIYDDEYYGTTVVISHDGDYTSYSSNLTADVSVQVGDTVAAGDVIGTVGETALIEAATPSHIHFAVTCHGEPVDPATFFS